MEVIYTLTLTSFKINLCRGFIFYKEPTETLPILCSQRPFLIDFIDFPAFPIKSKTQIFVLPEFDPQRKQVAAAN